MKEKLRIFREELNNELSNILQYWADNTLDHENGGFHGQIDHFNNIVPHAPKGAVLTTRILWTFSAAYNYSENRKYLKIAMRAFNYIKDHFYDHKNGGLIWEVDYLGNPSNTRKQVYAQGFGIYGFSEYFKASEEQESLDLSTALFNQIEQHSFDHQYGGYLEALSQDWSPLADMRLSEKDENYPKSMNTHLHILEPYTNLYRVWKNDELKAKIKSLIRIFLDHIIDQNTDHFNLFFENNWEVKSQIVSYGHDIEGTWLMTEAAEVIGDKKLVKEVQDVAIKMTDATFGEGADDDGSLFYEKNLISNHLDTDKHWWPQAEAMVGFMNAYQISSDENYLDKSMDIWRFIKNNMVDRKHGEWFWRVDKNGMPNEGEDKAGFWKCPYHNSRACMEAIARIDSISLKRGK